MLAHDEPPGYRQAKHQPKPKLEPFLPVIRQILEDDGKAPTKQKHTARRIFERLRDEHGYTGGETVAKDAVREWRISRREVFLPLSHRPGEAQVDFGEATIRIAGKERKAAIFVMTLPYSGAMFVQAFPKECTETFMEGHRRAFKEFGGVPKRITYDNSGIAVIEVLQGRERKLTREFLRLQSHYLFTEHFFGRSSSWRPSMRSGSSTRTVSWPGTLGAGIERRRFSSRFTTWRSWNASPVASTMRSPWGNGTCPTASPCSAGGWRWRIRSRERDRSSGC
jgi:hypothetical protein